MSSTALAAVNVGEFESPSKRQCLLFGCPDILKIGQILPLVPNTSFSEPIGNCDDIYCKVSERDCEYGEKARRRTV